MAIFRPKHSFQEVIRVLGEGLASGQILLDVKETKAFPPHGSNEWFNYMPERIVKTEKVEIEEFANKVCFLNPSNLLSLGSFLFIVLFFSLLLVALIILLPILSIPSLLIGFLGGVLIISAFFLGFLAISRG